jgi:hypothetical protein
MDDEVYFLIIGGLKDLIIASEFKIFSEERDDMQSRHRAFIHYRELVALHTLSERIGSARCNPSRAIYECTYSGGGKRFSEN